MVYLMFVVPSCRTPLNSVFVNFLAFMCVLTIIMSANMIN